MGILPIVLHVGILPLVSPAACTLAWPYMLHMALLTLFSIETFSAMHVPPCCMCVHGQVIIRARVHNKEKRVSDVDSESN